ncbi:IS3 family transposase [Pelobacter seleniigenes]|uniref:IS3 family transposase n=1 Tax=Pelobacter seleniigenes TaxID=407188 RepID=UPI003CCBE1C7
MVRSHCTTRPFAESFLSSLKTEWVFFSHYRTRENARRDITDYIEMFYNSGGLNSHLGYLSPENLKR